LNLVFLNDINATNISIICYQYFYFTEELDRRQLYGNVQRPNLDGSSSDSDIDQNHASTAVHNFARTALQTARHDREGFNLQQELEDMNLENMPGILLNTDWFSCKNSLFLTNQLQSMQYSNES